MLSVTATAIRQALDKPNRAHAGEIWRKVADRGGGPMARTGSSTMRVQTHEAPCEASRWSQPEATDARSPNFSLTTRSLDHTTRAISGPVAQW